MKQNESRLYARALGEDSLAAISPWLDRTRWRETYKGARRDILKAMTSTAKITHDLFLGQGEQDGDADVSIRRSDEQKLTCVLAAVDLMLDRCETTARNTSRLIRCWLVTSKPNSYQSNAFSVMTESNTRYRYRQTWKKFMAFIVRAWLLPTQTRRQIKVAIPAEIRRLVERVWDHPVWETLDTTAGIWPVLADDRYNPEMQCFTAADCDTEMEECDLGVTEAYESDYDSNGDTDWGSEDIAAADSSGTDEEDWLCEVETDNGSGECEYGPNQDRKPLDRKPLDRSTQVEFLELLFQLSITLSKQEFTDGNAASTLLVYFSGSAAA
ncbi:hypothetical protein LEL_10980 [Akanthomyces lecanii RCEF 1005]|uniref:Uncharacterized protein n=1 Tax=Akanthomyces lecanii RCEF 1005 TaxID=1081108 RepID=A0A167NNT7_CORDF|nr:hypothetical protein LEL_10980 [Akanthomyces lecanii RCEF 1005]